MNKRSIAVLVVAFVVLVSGCELVDTDGDGAPDALETAFGWDPADPDEDENFELDGYQDTDGDGVTDWEETGLGTDLNDPADPDTADNDGDGLPNFVEDLNGTDADDPDSDDDGASDYFEAQSGTDPNDPADFGDTDMYGLCVVAQRDPINPLTLHFTWDDTRAAQCDLSLETVDLVWNFGDGDQDVSGIGNRTISHTYADPGVYEVFVTCCDPDFPPFQDSVVVGVGVPHANFYGFNGCLTGTLDPDSPLTVHFNWDSGSPGCGAGTCVVADTEWLFDDGTPELESNSFTESHTYPASGFYSMSASHCGSDFHDFLNLLLND